MAPAPTVVARLDEAEARLGSLEREVAELRRLVAAPAAPSSAPAPAAAPVAAAVARPVPPARPAPPPPSPPRPVREPAPRRPRPTLAELLDARALAVAGGIVTLLGVVFLFVLAVNRGWIGPAERVLAGALVSGLLVAAGVVARRRYGQLDAALAAVGAGLAGGYATLLAATARYDLVDHAAALVLAAAIAAVGTAIALAWSAEILAGIGLVGAALAPAAVGIEGGIEVLGTAFAALVFAAIAVVGLRRGWTWLLVAGVAATAPQWVALLVAERDEPPGGAVAVAALLVALYLATAVVRALAAKRIDALSSVLVALSASLGVLSAAALLDDPGPWLLVLALPYAALAAALFGRARDLSALLAAAAMVVSALGFADLLGGLGLSVAWALQAAAFAWLAGRVREPRFAAASLAYLGLAVGHALAVEAPPSDLYTAGSDPAAGIPALLVVAGAAALVARLRAPVDRSRGRRPAREAVRRPRGRALVVGRQRGRDRRARRRRRGLGRDARARRGRRRRARVRLGPGRGPLPLVGARGGALRRRIVGGKPRAGGRRRRLAGRDGARRRRIRPRRARPHAGRVGRGRGGSRPARRRLRRRAGACAAAAARVALRDRRLPRVVRLRGLRRRQARRGGRLPRRRVARARGGLCRARGRPVPEGRRAATPRRASGRSRKWRPSPRRCCSSRGRRSSPPLRPSPSRLRR